MRLAWLTDIHLNFVNAPDITRLARSVAGTRADVVLISGDIAEAPTLAGTLEAMARAGDAQLLYVLGNHDFYRSRVAEVRASCRASTVGTYLHGAGPVRLTDEACVVGVDGWADGRLGRPRESELIFTDWHLIDDFREVDAVTNIDARLAMVQKFGDESAAVLRAALEAAVAADFTKIIVVTHYPPFSREPPPDKVEVAQVWVPWLVCKATGDVLLEFAGRFPHIEVEVLAGHVHVEYSVRRAPNLRMDVGRATYRKPEIQRVWQLDQRSKS